MLGYSLELTQKVTQFNRFLKQFYTLLFSIFLLSITAAIDAAEPTIQNSVEKINPANTAEDLQKAQTQNEEVPNSNIKIINNRTPSINPEDAKIKFKLRGINLSGNKSIPTKELEKLYQDKLNTEVSVADIELIAQNITEYYRDKGYVLSQAVIPEQEIGNDGIVKIQIIEGYVGKVSISGCESANVCCLLKKYGKHIQESKPLTLSALERFAFFADDIPGLQVRTVLTRSEETAGAADLTFVVTGKKSWRLCSI